jgi:hypothetical protein
MSSVGAAIVAALLVAVTLAALYIVRSYRDMQRAMRGLWHLDGASTHQLVDRGFVSQHRAQFIVDQMVENDLAQVVSGDLVPKIYDLTPHARAACQAYFERWLRQ